MSLVDAVKRAAKAHDDLPGFAKDALYINQSGGGREMTQFFDNNAAENEKRYQEYLALVKENATLRAENLTLHLDLSKIIAGLENDVARLTEAIEWLGSRPRNTAPNGMVIIHADTLKDRAFSPPTPQFEEVTVTRWATIRNNGVFSATYATKEDAERVAKSHAKHLQVIELTGKRRIPVPVKVKRREEIELHDLSFDWVSCNMCGKEMPVGRRFYAEWEE